MGRPGTPRRINTQGIVPRLGTARLFVLDPRAVPTMCRVINRALYRTLDISTDFRVLMTTRHLLLVRTRSPCPRTRSNHLLCTTISRI